MRAVFFRFCFIVARFSSFSYAVNNYKDEYYGPALFPGNKGTGSHRGLEKKPKYLEKWILHMLLLNLNQEHVLVAKNVLSHWI